jgi:hypothetical protein
MQDWDKIVAKIKAILEASTSPKEQQRAFPVPVIIEYYFSSP